MRSVQLSLEPLRAAVKYRTLSNLQVIAYRIHLFRDIVDGWLSPRT